MSNEGIPEISVVAISPMTPKVGIKVKLRMIPRIVVKRPSFRFMSVLSWLFMRFPVLRLPKAVYRYMIMYNDR